MKIEIDENGNRTISIMYFITRIMEGISFMFVLTEHIRVHNS